MIIYVQHETCYVRLYKQYERYVSELAFNTPNIEYSLVGQPFIGIPPFRSRLKKKLTLRISWKTRESRRHISSPYKTIGTHLGAKKDYHQFDGIYKKHDSRPKSKKHKDNRHQTHGSTSGSSEGDNQDKAEECLRDRYVYLSKRMRI